MGCGHAPKLPSYNLQGVVDVDSGPIVHHDVFNDANDTRPVGRGRDQPLIAESQGSEASPWLGPVARSRSGRAVSRSTVLPSVPSEVEKDSPMSA